MTAARSLFFFSVSCVRSFEQVDLELFLTRLVVSHGREDRNVFTTGPLIPLLPGNEPAQVRFGVALV